MNNPLKYVDPSGLDVEIEVDGDYWNVEMIDAILKAGFYLPPEMWDWLLEIINSPAYQAYLELKHDENNQIEEMEKSDEVYYFIVDWDPGEDEHDTDINVAYFISSSDIKRYRWNEDPAWWQGAEWQRDWLYEVGEDLKVLGRIAKGGIEICGGLFVGLFGVADMVGGTILSGGAGWFVTIPSGLYLIGQGYNIIAVGFSDVSLGALNPPTIPYLPEP